MEAHTMDSIRPIVEQYTTLGLVVIPVAGKRPVSVVLDEHGQPLRRPDGSAVRWQPFIERFPTNDELEAFEWERATGLAVILGPATWQAWPHLWTLDVEHECRSEAELWLDEHVPHWRDGVVVETGGGGVHVYFLASHPVTTAVVRWGEVRGQGSLCVLPPSRHPETGRTYRWLSERWTNLPQFEPTSVPGYAGYGGSGENGHQQGSLGREPLREVLRRTIPKGTRNVTLTRIAGLLRGQLDLSPDEVLTILRVLNDSHCEEPLPDEELQAISRSSGKWPANPVLLVNGNGHRQSPVTALRDDDSDDDPVAIDVSTLPEPPRRGWLVPDLLPEGTLTSWYGDDGTGKSVLAQALAICIASGQPFLDRPVQQGTVVFIDTEFDPDEFIRRAYQLARGMGFATPPAGLLYYRTRFSLTTPGGQRDIVRLVERYQPTLVVVDSVTLGVYGEDLKEASAAVTLMEFLQQLPTTVLVLDHIPKPPPGASLAYARPWGSFAKRAKARHAVLITQAEAGGIVLRVTKSNLAKAGAMVAADIVWTDDAIRVAAVSLDDDALAGVEHHLPALEQVYRTLCQHEAMTPEELAEETGLAVGTAKNKLTILRRQGRAEPLGDGRWRGIGPATLVVRGGGHQGVITITGYKASDSDDDGGKHHTPHREAKNGEHDPAGYASQAVITITHYKASDSDDDPEKHHTWLPDAKNGEHDPAGEDEKHHTWLPGAENAVCEVCGQSFAWSGRGRPARYCSRTCQMKAYRQRSMPVDAPVRGNPGSLATETNGHPPDPSVCLDCHQPITAEGFQYICPPCLKLRYDRLQREYPEKLIRWLEQHGR